MNKRLGSERFCSHTVNILQCSLNFNINISYREYLRNYSEQLRTKIASQIRSAIAKPSQLRPQANPRLRMIFTTGF